MKIVFTLLMIISLSQIYSPCFSEENKIRIVVFDLDAKSSEISQDEVVTLSDYMRNTFINTGIFEVISREQLNKVIEEEKLQMTGLTSESNAIETR